MGEVVSHGIERILENALKLYISYGIKSITMEDLCRETGISKKTLYIMVKDKTELIELVVEMERKIQSSSLALIISSENNSIDELILMNRYIHDYHGKYSPTFYFDLKKYYRQIYRDWMKKKREMMHDMILSNLEKGMEQGLYRQDLKPSIIAKLHLRRSEMIHSVEVMERNEMMDAEFVNEVFRYHIHGICNKKGLSYYKSKQTQLQ